MRLDWRIESILGTLAQAPPVVSAEKLAQDVNLSVSRLRHLFREEMRISLGRFLRSKQIEPVKTLLASSFLSVKEVMRETGFAQADEASFIREFKKVVGLTPGQFRRRSWAGQRRQRPKQGLRKAA